ncbi:class I adenylate-forming enzyme family protein [Streptomyces sp. STR69]|uniref:class I adenylate-forming enzyme family protein n=1 Tax=Streptomyces sp. STR69 TaxID=1796942 RepID=UPI0021CA6FEF|nr:AMP-binding protein [Streptomyces sp. STR69]
MEQLEFSAGEENSLRLLSDLVTRAAARWPDRTAVVCAHRTVTFAELRDAAAAAAGELRRAGLARGERVVIACEDPASVLALLLATAAAGAVHVLAEPELPGYAARHLLTDAAPARVLADASSSLAAAARAENLPVGQLRPFSLPVPARTAPEAAAIPSDPVSILYTSGSTGRPKGVVSTHANVLFAVRAIARRLRLTPDDVIGCVLPLTFDYGLYQLYLGLYSGAAVALGHGVDAGPGLVRFLLRHEVTVLPSVAGLTWSLCRLAERQSRRPPLRMLTNTGAALSPRLAARAREAFPGIDVVAMYGLTECKRVSVLLPEEWQERPTSVGRPLDDTEVLVLCPRTGQVLPPGEEGELVVRGPHLARGYWGDPQLTAQRFRRVGPAQETMLFTGDRGRVDAEGYVYVSGRDDDVYKANGFRVSAAEIALAAEDIPGVEKAHCLPGREDRPARLAVVTGRPAEEIRRELTDRIEWFKVPDHIRALAALPLRRNGKTDTAALEALLTGGTA